MNSDQILTTDFRIAQLMNVRYFGASNGASRAFSTRVVTKTLLFIVRKDRFPHEALLYQDYSVRTVVVVNRRLLARSPADHQHLNRIIAAHAMAPVISFLESDVRLQIDIENLYAGKPGIYLLQRWHAVLAVKSFNQLGKR